MTPDERNNLLFQVQRALDLAGIGRANVHTYAGGLLANGHVAVPRMNNDIEVQYRDISIAEPIATFTFDELFPPLNWYEWQDGIATEVDKVSFALYDPTLGRLTIERKAMDITIDFHTQDLAKEAAQSLADIMAKADRSRRAGQEETK